MGKATSGAEVLPEPIREALRECSIATVEHAKKWPNQESAQACLDAEAALVAAIDADRASLRVQVAAAEARAERAEREWQDHAHQAVRERDTAIFDLARVREEVESALRSLAAGYNLDAAATLCALLVTPAQAEARAERAARRRQVNPPVRVTEDEPDEPFAPAPQPDAAPKETP